VQDVGLRENEHAQSVEMRAPGELEVLLVQKERLGEAPELVEDIARIAKAAPLA